jgi:hypothetical protein
VLIASVDPFSRVESSSKVLAGCCLDHAAMSSNCLQWSYHGSMNHPSTISHLSFFNHHQIYTVGLSWFCSLTFDWYMYIGKIWLLGHQPSTLSVHQLPNCVTHANTTGMGYKYIHRQQPIRYVEILQTVYIQFTAFMLVLMMTSIPFCSSSSSSWKIDVHTFAYSYRVLTLHWYSLIWDKNRRIEWVDL